MDVGDPFVCRRQTPSLLKATVSTHLLFQPQNRKMFNRKTAKQENVVAYTHAYVLKFCERLYDQL